MRYSVGDPAGVMHSVPGRGTCLSPAVVSEVRQDRDRGQVVTFRMRDGETATHHGAALRDYVTSVKPDPRGRWAVLSVDVRQVLGRYLDMFGATAAALAFGGCSFAYELSADELARMDAEVTA